MSEKIDVTKAIAERGANAFLEISLMHLAGQNRRKHMEALSKTTGEGDDEKVIWDVSLTVNGIELSLVQLIERWRKNWTQAVEEGVQSAIPDAKDAAIRHIREKVDELDDQLDEWVDEVVAGAKSG